MKNKETLEVFKKGPKTTKKSTDGTSYYGIFVSTTAKSLIDIFGKEQLVDQCSKSKRQWFCETSNGKVFTVYDYKWYRDISLEEMVDYHIGGFCKEDTMQAKKEIEKILNLESFGNA